jgi:uncharacterized protein
LVTVIHLRCLRTDSGEGDPSPGSLRASRLDFVGRLDDKLERTPQGGLRIPAALTRVGVFAYRNADGSTRKEYRPAEEVFRADSLASLRGAPVTDLHPQVFVSPDNYKTLSVGHVGDEVRQDGRHVRAALYVQDKGVLDAVQRRDRKEISCGYSMRWDPTPGVFEGERYDGVQRDIVYNHVALGPANWGRAGRDVALRLDSQVSVQTQETTMLIKINGIEYDTSTPAFAQAYEAEQKRKDNLLSAANDTIGKLTKDKESLTARADSAEAALKDERDPVKRAKAVEARSTLENSARTLHGKPELKFDGKTDSEVKREALLAVPRLAALVEARKAVDPKLERSDDYLSALFDAETARATSQGGSNHQHVQDTITPKPTQQSTPAPAYVAPHERPLSYSRK